MESYKRVYIGLNIEKEDNIIAVILPDEGGFCLSSDSVSADIHKLSRYFERIVKRFGREALQVCYENLHEDFELQQTLTGWGIRCQVVEPIDRPADLRRKTGRRDAERLARLYREGKAKLVATPSDRFLPVLAAAAQFRPEMAAPARQSAMAAHRVRRAS